MRNAILRKVLHIMLAVFTALVLAGTVLAQQQNDRKPASNPLVRVLQAKGILTDQEVAMVSQASTAGEAEERLARLLLSKGIITQADYDQTVGSSIVQASADGATGARVVPAVLRLPASSGDSAASPDAQAAQKPAAGPAVIPAVAPIRVFPVDPPKREGLVPDIKVGPVRLKPYGFFKTSVVYDTSSPEGNDFPLPQFRVDTGPDAGHAFHIKARAFRLGSNFEWIDPSPNVAITGRFEFDFEGNFSRVANRNISSIRSSMAGIRLAWARVDYAATDNTTVFALFGQDWTPFPSSTLPNLLETTGFGLGYGVLWERAPQVRFGFNHNFGGAANFKIQPEVAMVLPAFGNVPLVVDNELAFGERQGVDSGRPEIQGRIVAQFQLDKAKGVAPAQLIVSGMQGRRRATVLASAILARFKGAGSPFQNGAMVESDRAGYTAEVQLPTRYATLIAKYYNGEDLRFYFGGQFASNFNDTSLLVCRVSFTPVSAGGTGCPAGEAGFVTAPSVDASSNVAFGFAADGTTVLVAPQRPVRSQGGFVNLAFPLGRIFNANPEGRNAGWQLYLHYGIDEAKTRDVRRTTVRSSRGDLAAATLLYKLNNWVTFGFEQSLYVTRVPGPPPFTTLFRGIPAREARDLRSEFGTIFTF